MSCRRRTAVLRIPASALGFVYRREWNEFLRKHENDFEWEPGYFNESLSDEYPVMLWRRSAFFKDPDRRLDQRDPNFPEIVPGPFLDYFLEEILPLSSEDDSFGENDTVLPLTYQEKEKYLHLYKGLFPDFTLDDMDAVRYCRFEWYDGSNAPYLYSDPDVWDPAGDV